MDVEEIFREAFSIKESVEILRLMEAVITVAAFKHPDELVKRRSRIMETLLNIKPRKVLQSSEIEKGTCISTKIDDLNEGQKRQRRVIKLPARRRSKVIEEKTINQCRQSYEVMNYQNQIKKREEDHDQAMESRLASSKRKLQERYDELKRGRKKIQVLELKDLPKAPILSSSKFTSHGNRMRRGINV